MASDSYLDFDLEIEIGQGRNYPVRVLQSSEGEAREIMRFPFDELALENSLLKLQNALLRSDRRSRRINTPEEQTVQDFGRALFEALLTGEIRTRYDMARREAGRQGKDLRVRLRIQAPELAALPWEFLYDHRQGDYICLSGNTPLIRYLELPQPRPPLEIKEGKLRILGMAVSPSNLDELDIEREKQRVEQAVKKLQEKGLLELVWLEGQTWRDLQRIIRRGPWHIFHFIGHGRFDRLSDEGQIALTDDNGEAQFLSATQLGRFLADHHPLRLVLLNSCEGAQGSQRDIFSSTASILVRRGIPAVLAMQYEITDRAAIEFSRTFYESIADNLPVDTAVTETRKALSITNGFEWGTPVLFMRASDGQLFDFQSVGVEEKPLVEPLLVIPLPAPPVIPTAIAQSSISSSDRAQTRARHLEDMINQAYELIAELEAKRLRWADDPAEKSKLDYQINNQRKAIAEYEAELKTLGLPSNPPANNPPKAALEATETELEDTLDTKTRQDLVRILESLPTFGEAARRQGVLDGLPPSIKSQLPSPLSMTNRLHITTLVRTCLNFSGGLKALLDAVLFADDGTQQAATLRTFIAQHLIKTS